MVARIDEEKGVPLAPETPWEEIDADLTEDHHDEAAAVISRGWSGNESLLAAAIMQTADGNLQTIYAAMIGLCLQVDEFRKVAQTALQKAKRLEFDNHQLTRQMEAWQTEHATDSTEQLMSDFVRFIASQNNFTANFTADVIRLVGRFEERAKKQAEERDV